MAQELRAFTVLTPAGTPISAPLLTPLTMPARIVTGVRIRIPRGPAGQLGLRLASAGTQVVPWNSGSWVIADDEVYDEPLEGFISSGAWQLQSYNTGLWDHTVQVLFRLLPVGQQATTLAAPLLEL